MLLPQGLEAGGGERLLLAADAFDFGDKGVGVEGGERLEFVAGFFDGEFNAQPIEDRALGLLPGGGDFDQAADGGFGGCADFGCGFSDGDDLNERFDKPQSLVLSMNCTTP